MRHMRRFLFVMAMMALGSGAAVAQSPLIESTRAESIESLDLPDFPFVLPLGECFHLDADVETGVKGIRSIAYLVRDDTLVDRRILIGFDSAGRQRSYSDSWRKEGVTVSIDLAEPTGTVRAPLAGSALPGSWSAPTGQLMSLDRIGPPNSVIRHILARCGGSPPQR